MVSDYSKKGKVVVDMTKYTNETYKMFPRELMDTVSSPASDNLFEVREDAQPLNEHE